MRKKSIYTFTSFIIYANLNTSILYINAQAKHQQLKTNDIHNHSDIIIVGGTEVVPGRYSYMVALTTFTGFRFCGGSLIAPEYVLTAAHCATDGNTQVLIGRHNLSSLEEKYETIPVEYEVIHPGYVGSTLENDIMVLKLERESTYAPVAYDKGNANVSSGVEVSTMGWGRISYGGNSSDILLETEVDVKCNCECNRRNVYNGKVTDDMVCASRPGKDSCQGDSGGPLIIKGNDTATDTVVGIVSWGIGCAFASYPGVYSRVGTNSDFVDCVVNGGTDCGVMEECTKKKNTSTLLYVLRNLMI